MVRTNCSVYGCNSTSKYNKVLKFHRFPRDERSSLWIQACQRPDLKKKTIEQLYNMHVCSLHFEKWMYMKTKLKNSAIPVSNLPSASLHPMCTQTETTNIEIIKDTTKRGVQEQNDIASVAVAWTYKNTTALSVAASTGGQSSQTEELTDHTPRKRKLRKEIRSCPKKLKTMEDAESTGVTYEQFLQGCDKFLSPSLSKSVKAQAKFKTSS